jgi:hypothetical protein
MWPSHRGAADGVAAMRLLALLRLRLGLTLAGGLLLRALRVLRLTHGGISHDQVPGGAAGVDARRCD